MRVLRAQPSASFAGGVASAGASLIGYEGSIPGPVLRIKQGEELRVRLTNALAEPTSVHWHGVRLANAMDGVARLTQQPVEPGASFDYVFRAPDAGTFWYHAHSVDQASRGLYGALVVEERERVDADRDLALVLSEPVVADAPVLINGSVLPNIAVQSGERVRLRLINAAMARGFSLQLGAAIPWIAAIDGQPIDPFLPHEGRIGLAPGSRIDLVLDITGEPGTALLLSVGRGQQAIGRLLNQPGGTPRTNRPAPAALPSNPLPARIDLKTALRAELVLANAAGDLARAPMFKVKRGSAVSLGIQNPSRRPHVVHVHGHSFRLLDRLDDGWKPYWLDTLVVGEAAERIAFVADNPGSWLIESRLLDRPFAGTANWFAVT